MERKKDKSTLWFLVFVISILTIVSGAVITITSQLGENFHTSLVEQIQAGNPPFVTFIGLGLMLLPSLILLLLAKFTGILNGPKGP